MHKLFPIFYAPEGDGGTPQEPSEGGNGGPQTTFTQEQMDAILGERLKRAKKAATADFLQSLGVGSVDDIKAQLGELAKLKEAQMSDAEKQAAELAALRQQVAEGQAQAEKAKEALARQKVETAVLLAAGNFQNPQDALSFVDLSAIELGDDGKVTGVDKALEALSKEKPYLLKTDSKANGSFVRRNPAAPNKPSKPTAPTVRF